MEPNGGGGNEERFGRSKSMDKRLAASRMAVMPDEWFASFAFHLDDEARRRAKNVVQREELQELANAAHEAMRSTFRR